jgi:hypothetical protein
MPIKKTKIRTEASRILAETIIGPKKTPIDRTGDADAPKAEPAQHQEH